MTLAEMKNVIDLIIDGREMVGTAYIDGSDTHPTSLDIVAKLRNKDGIGCRNELLASLPKTDHLKAIQLRNAINM